MRKGDSGQPEVSRYPRLAKTVGCYHAESERLNLAVRKSVADDTVSIAVEGHGFSRAVELSERTRALAPEGKVNPRSSA
jgi:hypothetical protein